MVLTSWLLAVPYLLTAAGIVLIGWFIGSLFIRALSPANSDWLDSPGMGLLLPLVKVATGFAVVSWCAAVTGVAGWFGWPTFLVLAVVVGVNAAAAQGQPAQATRSWRRDVNLLAEDWRTSDVGERALCGFIALGFLCLSINAIIGALVPDMNQDPMWYHLSVPQQWMFSGRFDAYPDVMQSAFPLAGESLFAVIFLLKGNEILCSLLVAIGGIMALAIISCAAWASTSGDNNKTRPTLTGAMTVLGVCIPLFTNYGLLAPIQPKNDMIMYLWISAGAMLLAVPVLGRKEIPGLKWWVVSGFLMGTGICAKPNSLPVAAFLMLFVMGIAAGDYWTFRRRRPKDTLIGAAAWTAMLIVAVAPWWIRGNWSHGVPLYPVGIGLFPLNEAFAAMNRSYTNIQGVPGGTWQELLTRIHHFPHRLRDAANSEERFFFVYCLAVLAGLVFERGRWRWLSVILLLQLPFPVGVKGGVEVFRLFSPAYFLACLLIARLAADVAPYMGNRLKLGAGFVVCGVVFYSQADLQWQMARMRTMQWGFRPVLSEEDVLNRAAIAEKGFAYKPMAALRQVIPENARVLMLGFNYPYYLHRDTLWNDEAVGQGGLEDRWNHMSTDAAIAFLKREKIDFIVTYGNLMDGSTVKRLARKGILATTALEGGLEAQGWGVYRMKRQQEMKVSQ